MSVYTFSLDSFVINHRRTNHPWGGGTDTIFSAAGLRVGDQAYPPQSRGQGPLGDTGTSYGIGLRFENIEVDDLSVSTVLSFVLVNSGHSDHQATYHAINVAADGLANTAAASISLGTSIWGAIVAGSIAVLNDLFKDLVPIFDANCDGPLAADAIGFTGDDLDKVAAGQSASQSREYPGMNSPSGCGGNSDYTVAWSVTCIDRGFPGIGVAASADRVETFYRGQNRHLWRRRWEQSTSQWRDEEDLGGVLTSSPSGAYLTSAGAVDLFQIFYRGQSGSLWHMQVNEGGQIGEEDLGGILTSAPHAIATPTGIEIYYRGQNSHLWRRVWDQNSVSWRDEEDLGGILTSSPSAAYFNGITHIFYRGQSGSLWHMRLDVNGATEEDLGGGLTSAPGAVASPDRLEIYYRGGDKTCWRKVWDQTTIKWLNEEEIGAVLTSPPAGVYFSPFDPKMRHLFYRGQSKSLWHMQVNDSGLIMEEDLGGILI